MKYGKLFKCVFRGSVQVEAETKTILLLAFFVSKTLTSGSARAGTRQRGKRKTYPVLLRGFGVS